MASRLGVPILNKATVLVVLPVFNAAPFLRAALDSVLSQSGVDLQVLAINDGSTDDSAAILEAERDSRLVTWRQANTGLVATINRGFAFAQEQGIPFVARMDADDISEPTRLATQLAILQANPDTAACSCNCHYIDTSGTRIGSSTVPLSSCLIAWELRHNLRGMVHGASTFRTAALAAVGGCRLAFLAAEDVDLFLRLSESYRLINSPEYLYRIRLNPGSLSVANTRRNSLYCMYAIDCARRRSRREKELPFAAFEAQMSPWQRLQLRKELWVLSLWRRGISGQGAAAVAGALLSPRRVVARVLRRYERRESVRRP